MASMKTQKGSTTQISLKIRMMSGVHWVECLSQFLLTTNMLPRGDGAVGLATDVFGRSPGHGAFVDLERLGSDHISLTR